MTMKATPGQLIFGRDMIFDLSFRINWNELRKRKRDSTIENNRRENAKRIKHIYDEGDMVMLTRKGIQGNFMQPRDGPYQVTQVYTNGTIQIQRGPIEQKVSIRRVVPYFER